MASNEVAYVLESKSVIINAPIYQEEVHMPVGSRYPSFWCVPNWDNVIFWRLYEWYMLTLVLLIPFTVMSVAYFIICIKVWAVMKQRSGMSSSSGKPQESYRLTVYKGSRYQNSMRQTQMETKLVPSSNGVATSTRIKFTDDNSNLKQSIHSMARAQHSMERKILEHSFNGKGPTQYGKEDPRMYKEEDYGILIMIIHAQLNWEEKGIKIDGEFMSNLRFADDIFRNPRQIIRDAPTTIGRNYPNGIKNEHQKDKGACVENVEIKKYLDGLDENQRVRVKLATAYRSFDYFNLNEGICNHLSALAPAKSGNGTVMFLVPYGLHWSEVTPSKLVGVNDKFEVVEGDGQPEVSAMCIHKGIYAERKGTSSIMHSHPPYATALSLKKNTRVKPLHQSYMYFHNNIAYNHTFDGVVDTLVEGNRLGKVLKDKHTLMMGNHGVLVASDSIEKAFVLNYYLERICMFQILAESTGDELLEIPEKTIAQDATKIY
ncbi:putative aldolase class 2 protein [Nymphon striatum]|nr:putative aldolase class 2 protein [Nymphon striatum]